MDAEATRIVRVGNIEIGNNRPFVLIAGPCQIESRAHALEIAHALRAMSERTGGTLIYQYRYDKSTSTSD